MKKSFTTLGVFTLFFVGFAFGQTRVGISVRPSLPVSKVALPGFTNIDDNGNEEVVLATLGAGVSGIVSIENSLNEHITIGLGIEVFRSFSGELVKENVPVDDVTTRIKFSANSINLLPNVQIHTGDKGFYTKLGLILALNPELEATVTATGVPGRRVEVYQGNMSLGLQAGLGLNKEINEKLSWFTELTLVNLVHRPKELVNTENFGGPTDPTIEYVKERNLSDSSKDLTFPIPYHNIGLNIGLKFSL